MKWIKEEITKIISSFAIDFKLGNSSLELLKLGQNGIFLMRDKDLVLRVYRSNTSIEKVANEVEVCKFLASKEFPCMKPIDFDNKYIFEYRGLTITLWSFYENKNDNVDFISLGVELRKMHKLLEDFTLPHKIMFNPFESIMLRLNQINDVDLPVKKAKSDLLKLTETLYLQSRIIDMKSESVIHGDLHPGNIINTKNGIVFIDFEGVSYGDPRWDLIPLAVSSERFNITSEQYNDFVLGYGYNIKIDNDYLFFKKVRELFIIAWLSQFIYEKVKKEEFLRRVKSYVGGDLDGGWNAK